MMMRTRIERKAAWWLEELDRAEGEEELNKLWPRFAAWLEGSAEHRATYLKLEESWVWLQELVIEELTALHRTNGILPTDPLFEVPRRIRPSHKL